MKNRNSRSWFRLVTIGILLCYGFTLLFDFVAVGLAQDTTTNYSDIVLQNGDAVRFVVWEGWHSPSDKSILASFNSEFVIDGNGNIRLPVIGIYKIAGKKTSNIEMELQEQLMPFAKSPSVTCIPLIRVTLLGAFNRPGTYRIKADATFWELVDRASGPSNNVDFSKSRVKREGKVIIKDLIRSFERGQSIFEMGIESGDQIYFAEKSKLTFDQIIRYVNFGISMLMLALTFENYRSKNKEY